MQIMKCKIISEVRLKSTVYGALFEEWIRFIVKFSKGDYPEIIF